MRFNNRVTLKERAGEQRIVRKFLWWPRTFGTITTRWLEYTNIIEEVQKIDVGGSFDTGVFAWKWVEIGFGDDK
jgi:hypothetical protein